jgi:hypothetical protein
MTFHTKTEEGYNLGKAAMAKLTKIMEEASTKTEIELMQKTVFSAVLCGWDS